MPGKRVNDFLEAIRYPAAEFGPHPFWFWNDDLDEAELLRQLRAFHEADVGGVVIHPRIGLSRRIGYLTDAYFRLVRRVVDECAALGMKVVLYDEGSYPSGSACGRVVEENPEYAARSLALVHKEIDGPFRGYWRPHLGRSLVDRLVCVAVGRRVMTPDGAWRVDADTLALLEPEDRGLVRLDLPPGPWVAMACIDTPSGGTIRGVYPEQESGSASGPPAGDLMNPEAVAAFVRLTHDAYYEHLRDHFGKTVVAFFTDEPNPLGRAAKRNVRPYTRGFAEWLDRFLAQTFPEFHAHLKPDVRAWLPALWLDFGPQTAVFRQAYEEAVHRRVVDVFYKALSAWCEQHGVALTGHPNASNDMATLATFGWPGQDMVWRWVTPGDGSALEGAHSVAPKAATSSARAHGKRRIVSELLGAYGWQLSLDEVKWLLDWHLVRGNNLLMPHAFFYSVREGRAFESEPDLGLHNVWWPYMKHVNRYVRRMCWLLTDCRHVCDVAVLGPGRALPWRAARSLYRHQLDFLYIDEEGLERALVDRDASGARLRIGEQAYRVVIVDGRFPLPPAAEERLDAFRAAGGVVIDVDGSDEAWIEQVRAATGAALRVRPSAPDLRVMHVQKSGLDVFLLSNEGESRIQGELTIAVRGRYAWYDPLRDQAFAATPLPATGAPGGRDDASPERASVIPIELERRESRLLIVDREDDQTPGGAVDDATGGAKERAPGRAGVQATCGGEVQARPVSLEGPWRVTQLDGSAVPAPAPGDWAEVPQLECWSGTLCYHTVVTLPGGPARVDIDLGRVGEIAEVRVNGQAAGLCMWPPYRISTPGDLWRAGENVLEVRVTNSAANAYEGSMRPSGLIGPMRLIVSG